MLGQRLGPKASTNARADARVDAWAFYYQKSYSVYLNVEENLMKLKAVAGFESLNKGS